MRFTPRRRAVIAVLAAGPVLWLCIGLGWPLVYGLLLWLRNPDGYVPCRGGLSGRVARFNGCGITTFNVAYALAELVGLCAVAAAVAYGLARWVAYPIRDLADSVGSFGPNSLGLRLRADGPRDETRELSDAIDAMLDRLADGYEAQRRFAANASHELRTPLATQRALIEVSLASALTPEQLDLLSRQLLATNERNERLVDGLLTLAETERGLVTTTPLRFDRLLAAAVDAVRATAEQGGLTVVSALAPVTVVGEAPLLERLATNLVSNAVKYNRPDGTVRVELTADGVFTVTNTGPVVPPEQVAGLFEPFRRLSGERLEHGGGVGLGLTIARSIVAAHRGAIEAVPAPGGGLVVSVRLRPAGVTVPTSVPTGSPG